MRNLIRQIRQGRTASMLRAVCALGQEVVGNWLLAICYKPTANCQKQNSHKPTIGQHFFLARYTFVLIAVPLVFAWFSLSSASAAAGIYRPINYQGKLSSSGGIAIANGTYNMRFKIFTQATGGVAAWTETWNGSSQRVTSTGGLFSIALGTHVTMTGSVDFNSDSLYLQVEFDPGNDGTYEEVFSPRRRFASVPYAHNANTLDGLDSTQFIRADQSYTASGTITIRPRNASKIGIDIISSGGSSATGALRLSTQGGPAIVFGSGGVSYDTNLYRASANTLKTDDALQVVGTISGSRLNISGNSHMSGALFVKGNVGIGTTNPVIKLTVSDESPNVYGAAREVMQLIDATDFAAGVGGGMSFMGKGNTAGGLIQYASLKGIKENATDGNYLGAFVLATSIANGTPTERLRVDSSGNMGINTTTPRAKLEVAGSISGATLFVQNMSGAGLTDCDAATSTLRWDATNETFSCGTGGGFSTGAVLAIGDARYVKKQGDTMTGTLVLNPQSGLALNARGTISGSLFTQNGAGNNYFMGNVGIGMTTPRTPLYVAGSGSFTGTMSGKFLQVTGTGGTPLITTNGNTVTTTNLAVGDLGAGFDKVWTFRNSAAGVADFVIRPGTNPGGFNNGYWFTIRNTGYNTYLQSASNNTLNIGHVLNDDTIVISNTGGGTSRVVFNQSDIGVGTGTPRAKLEVAGSISGATLFVQNMSGAGLTDCDAATSTLRWDATNEKFSCGTGGGFSTGAVLAIGDARYVKKQGDTMTGTLVLTPTAGSGVSALRIVGKMTLTGSTVLQSGAAGTVALVVKGAVGQTGNLQEWQNSAGTVVSKVTSAGTFVVPQGSSSVPGLTFLGDENTGLFLRAGDRMSIVAGGANFFEITNSTQDTAVINDSSADIDFIVRSTGVSNAFFVQGSNGDVGISTSAPKARLDVVGTISGSRLSISNNANVSGSLVVKGNIGVGITPGVKMDIQGTDGTDAFYIRNSNGTSKAIVMTPIAGPNAAAFTMNFGGVSTVFLNSYGAHSYINNGAGNFGIGTTTPRAKLEVNGSMSGKTLFVQNMSGAGLVDCDASTSVLLWDATNEKFSCGSNGGFSTGAVLAIGDARYVKKQGDTMTGALVIDITGGDKSTLGLRVMNTISGSVIRAQNTLAASGALVVKKYAGTGTGNILVVDTIGLVYDATNKRVGVGTASPSAKLHVKDNNVALTFGDYSAADYAKLALSTTNASRSAWIELANSSGETWEVGKHLNNKFTIQRSGAGSIGGGTLGTDFVMDSNGLIGIGSSSPKAKLDVSGTISGSRLSISNTANISGALLVKGNVGIGTTAPTSKLTIDSGDIQLDNNQAIRFKRSGITDPIISYNSSNEFNIFNPVDAAINFSVNSGEVAEIVANGLTFNGSKTITTNGGSTYLTLSSGNGTVYVNGNLGIGTTSPRAKLEVAGSISGATLFVQNMSGAGLVDCDASTSVLLWDATNEKFSCGTGGGFSTGAVLAIGDARYVKKQGDTMTGALVINSSGGYSNSALLEVLGTMSGRQLYVTGTGSLPTLVTHMSKVGIGTALPAYAFDVRDTSGNQRFYVNTSGAEATSLYINDIGAASRFTSIGTSTMEISNAAALSVTLDQQNTASSAFFNIQEVGVTTLQMGVTGGTSVIQVTKNDASLTVQQNSAGILYLGSTHVDGKVDIRAGGVTALYASADGLIGIGTTAPKAKLDVVGTISGSRLVISQNGAFSGSLVVRNNLSGSSLFGFGLGDCNNATTSKLVYNNSTGKFSCATDQTGGSSTFGTGNVLTLLGSYVQKAGDTMTGALVISVTGGDINTVGLKVINTLSGAHLHAEKLLTTSGAAVIAGTLNVFTAGTGNPVLSTDTSGANGNGRVVIGAGGAHGQTVAIDPRGSGNYSTFTSTAGGLRFISNSFFDGTVSIGTLGTKAQLHVLGTISGSRLNVSGNSNMSGALFVKGNVGIGTTAPAAALHVRGNAINIGDSTDSGHLNFEHSSGDVRWQLDYAGSSLHIRSPLSGVTHMTFSRDSGNVSVPTGSFGIGTGTPRAKLEVAGSISGATLFVQNMSGAGLVDCDASTSTLRWDATNEKFSCGTGGGFSTGAVLAIGDARYVKKQGDTMTGALVIRPTAGVGTVGLNVAATMSGRGLYISGTGGSTAPLLYTKLGNGYVGIGTTAPTEKLEVYGGAVRSYDTTYGGISVLRGYGYFNGNPTTAGLYMSGAGNQGIMMESAGNYINLQNASGVFSINQENGQGSYTLSGWDTTLLGKVAITSSASAGFTPLTITTSASQSVNILSIGKSGNAGGVLTVDSAGDMGIGTTTPGSRLSVSGSVIIGQAIGSRVARAQLEVAGSISGATLFVQNMSGAGLVDCDASTSVLRWDATTEKFSCGAGGGFGTGAVLAIGDARYVKKQGDTMTGALVIDITGGNINTVGLKVINTLSGAHLHAESQLTVSGVTILNARGATQVPLAVRGAASQSANLQEWQNSAGTVLTRVDSSGNMRIGANSNLLDLIGNATNGGTIGVNGQSNQIFLANGGSVGIGSEAYNGKLFVAGRISTTNGQFYGYGGYGLSWDNSDALGSNPIATFSTQGVEKFRISATGLVGIGTTAPKAQLDVVGTISGSRLSISNNANISGSLLVLNNITARGTISGAILHASSQLRSSGTLVVGGTATFKGTIENGLAAWFPMDTSTGSSTVYTPDLSVTAGSGKLISAPTLTTGKFGRALNFDGTDDYVTLGDVTALNSTSQFTISGWFNQTTLDEQRNMFDKILDASNMVRARTWSDGLLYSYVYNAGTSYGYFDYSKVVRAGQWFHYTMVFDGSQSGNAGRMKVYINGVSQVLSFVGTIPAATANLSGVSAHLGNNIDIGVAGSTWKGGIDEVRIYSRALSTREIADLYRSGSQSIGGTMSGMVILEGNASTLLNIRGTASGERLHANRLLTASGMILGESGALLDGGTFYVDAGNNRVGIRTTTPVASLTVKATNDTSPALFIKRYDSETAYGVGIGESFRSGEGGIMDIYTQAGSESLDASLIRMSVGSSVGIGTRTARAKLEVAGSISGATLFVQNMSGAGLVDCDASTSVLLWDATTEKFSCGAGGGFGTGAVLAIGDARYVKKQGDTMTGALVINVTGGDINTVGLKVLNTLSGAHLHAERLLTSSGMLITESGALIDGSTFYVDAGNNRVGVGTLSPAETFDVAGTAKFTANASYPLGYATFMATTGTAPFAGGTAQTGLGFSYYGDGSVRGGIFVDNSGYFRISSSATLGGNITFTAGSTISHTAASTFTPPGVGSVPVAVNLVSGQTANALNITSNGGSAGNLFNVTAAGLVGIGTTAPKAKLDVVGTISGSRLSISNNANISGSLLILNNLTVRGTFSGATLHASSQLRSSGTLVVEGNAFIGGTIENGLAAWFPMDTSTGSSTVYTPDLSVTAGSGKLVSGPTFVQGKFGRAMSFDGVDDYVDAGDVNALDGVSAFTVSAWMKRTNSNSVVVIAKGTSISSDVAAELWSDGKLYVEVGNGTNAFGSVNLPGTEWQHVTMVFDGTQTGNANRLKAYVNGVLQNLSFNSTIPSTTPSNSASLMIGKVDYTPGQSNGLIDDVRIYSRPLSAREAAELYRSGSQSVGGTMSGVVILEGNASTLLNVRGTISGARLSLTNNNASTGSLILQGLHPGMTIISNNVAHTRNVVSYSSTSASVTGTMKITMPKTWSNTMLGITIRGHNYVANANKGDWEVHISGYNFASAWHNYSAEIRGSPPFTQVRLAHDGTKNVILLGTTSTAWAYPKVVVTDIIAMQNDIRGWDAGWSVGTITDETGIASIVTPAIPTYLTQSGNFGIGTTSARAKLEVAGSISGATLFVQNMSGAGLVDCDASTSVLRWDATTEKFSCGPGGGFGTGAVLAIGDARYVKKQGDTMTGALVINVTGGNKNTLGLQVINAISGSVIRAQNTLAASGALVVKKYAGTGTGNILVVDTTGLVYDATNKRVGVGTSAPSTSLQIGTPGGTAENTLRIVGYDNAELSFYNHAGWAHHRIVSRVNGGLEFHADGVQIPSLDITYYDNAKLVIANSDPDRGLQLGSNYLTGVKLSNVSAYDGLNIRARYGAATNQFVDFNFEGDGSFGTATNSGLYLMVGNTDRAVLDTSGNFGIGSLTPKARLDVRGTISGSRLNISGNSHLSGALFVKGNVGIGTTSPSEMLHLKGDGSNGAMLRFDNGATAVGNIGVSGSDSSTLSVNRNVGAARNLRIYDGTTNIALQVVGSSGNVGIGTTTPRAKLEVAGSISGATLFVQNMSGAGLVDCDASTSTLRWDATNEKFSCGTGGGFSTGAVLAIGDARYVKKQGDTMTGALVIDLTSGHLGLRVIQTMSGNVIHAEKTLTSSGLIMVTQRTVQGSGALVVRQLGNSTGAFITNSGRSVPVLVLENSSGSFNGASKAQHILFGYNGTFDVALFRSTGAILNLSGHLLPSITNKFDLGSSARRWRDLYLSGGTLHLGAAGDEATLGFNSGANRFDISANGDATPEFVIMSTGDIGVGTADPGTIASWVGSNQKVLNVYTNGSSDTASIVAQGDAGASLDLVDLGGASNDKWLRLYVDNGIGKFASLLDNGNGNKDPILAMDLGTGFVGVGTSSPDTKLDVVGTISGSLITQNGAGSNYFLGNVGVGTTSPATILHSKGGNIRAEASSGGDYIQINPDSNTLTFFDNGVAAINFVQASSVLKLDSDFYVGTFNAGTAGDVATISNNAASQNILHIRASGVVGGLSLGAQSGYGEIQGNAVGNGFQDLVLQRSAGNVGINTATPRAKLEVAGSISGATLFAQTFSGAGLVDCDAATQKLLWDSATEKFSCGTVSSSSFGTGNVLTIGDARYVNQSGDTMTGALRITKSGGYYTGALLNVLGTMSGRSLYISGSGSAPLISASSAIGYVGIGTASPTAKLTVSGNGGATSTLLVLAEGASNNAFIKIKDGASGGTWDFQGLIDGTLGIARSGGRVMTIGSDGSLRMDSATAKAKLDVPGTISGSRLVISKNGAFSGSLVVRNNFSGSSLFGFGLGNCSNATTSKLIYNNSTGKFSCATDQSGGSGTFGTGNVITIGDDRYVRTSGDTVTGSLTILNGLTVGGATQLVPSARVNITGSGTSNWRGIAAYNSLTADVERGAATIVGARRDLSADPFMAFGTWDSGTRRALYVGGGNWSMPDATGIQFYAAPTYDESNGVSGNLRMLITGQSGGAIKLYAALTGSVIHAEKSLTSSGALVFEGTASGSSLYVASAFRGVGLTDCDNGSTSKLLWDATTGRFTCGTDQTAASGMSQTDGDLRYVRKSGSTMTGPLIIDITNGNINTVGLKVINTLSGAHLHAEKLLTSSGALRVEGTGDSYIMGNVGVGTASPQTALHVFNSGTSQIRYSWAADQSLGFGGDGSQGPYVASHTKADGTSYGNYAAIKQKFGAGGFIVSTSPATTIGNARTFTDRFIIEPTNGYVGIGTTAPKAKLDVFGTISGSRLSISNIANISGALLVKGNVGIGTTSPSYALEVAGDIVSSNRSDWFTHASAGTLTAEWIGDTVKLASGGSNAYKVALLDGKYRDFRATVSFKTTNSTHWGVAYHAQDAAAADNHYGVVLRNTNQVRVQKRVSATQTSLIAEANTGVDHDNGEWHSLNVEVVGQHITVDVDGSNIISQSIADTTFGSGSLGFFIYDGTVEFNNFTVHEINEKTLAKGLLVTEGNVGIGTTSPSSKLEVVGSISGTSLFTNSTLDFQTSVSGFATSLFATPASNQFTIQGASNVINMNQNAVVVGSSISPSQTYLEVNKGSHFARIGVNSSEAMRIINGGNVGINTTTPRAKLEVNGSMSGKTLFVQNMSGAGLTDCDASTSKLLWDSTTEKFSCGTDDTGAAGMSYSTAEGIFVNQGGDTMTGALTINVTGGDINTIGLKVINTLSGAHLHAEKLLTSSGVLRVEGTGDSYIMGNLGIGTTTPSQPLEVVGNILSKNGSVGGVYVFDTAHGIERNSSELFVKSNAAISMRPSGAEVARFTSAGLIVNDANGANFDFLVKQQGAGTVLFADVSTGLVGIGTTAPKAKLDVFGTISGSRLSISNNANISGALLVKNNTTVRGNLSGATLTISSLKNCDTIDTDVDGNLVCGTDQTAGSGLDQSTADARYVRKSGSTMTGPLIIDITGGNINTIGLKVINTLSGAHLHAEKLLTTSGAAVIAGTLNVFTAGTGNPVLSTDTSGANGNGRVVIGAGGAHGQTVAIDPRGSGNYSTFTSTAGGLRFISNSFFDGTVSIGTLGTKAQLHVLGTISGSRLSISNNANISGALLVKGNVGIGTTSPTQKLQISGNMRFDQADPKIFYEEDGSSQASSVRFPVVQPNSGNLSGSFGVMPSGSSTEAAIKLFGSSTIASGQHQLGFGGGFSGAPADTWAFGAYVNQQVTADSRPLAFMVSNTSAGRIEAMRIAINGNVGIGTTTPKAKLDVAGTISGSRLVISKNGAFSGSLVVRNNLSGSSLFGFGLGDCSNATTSKLIYNNSTGKFSCASDQTGGGSGLSFTSAEGIYVNQSGDTMTGALVINVTGGDKSTLGLRVMNTISGSVIRAQNTLAASGALVVKKYAGTGTGNILVVDTMGLVYDATNKRVGVGTASPGSKLQINIDAAATKGLIIKGAASQTADFVNLTSNGGATGDLLTFNKDGWIGVGTASPRSPLNLHGGSTSMFTLSTDNVDHGMTALTPTDVYARLSYWGGSTGGFQLRGLSDDDAVAAAIIGTVGATSTTQSAVVIQGTKKNGTTQQALTGNERILDILTTVGSPLFSFTANGRLGIGTTSPKATLDVLGTISGSRLVISGNGAFSGSLVVRNNLSGSSLFGFGLGDCSNATTSKLIYNSTTGKFSCATDQTGGGSGSNWSNTGSLQISFDKRYVNQSGDTMTGGLRITKNGGYYTGALLNVLGVGSGKHMFGQKGVSSSGSLAVEQSQIIGSGAFVLEQRTNSTGAYMTVSSVTNRSPVLVLENNRIGTESPHIMFGYRGTFDVAMRRSAAGTLALSGSLVIDNTLTVQVFGAATATTVCRTSTGMLAACSSSLRYKEDVQDLSMGLDTIRQMRAVNFKWQGRDERDFGFIAEEMEAINPLFVEYDAQGQVQGVKYMQLTAVLTKAVQALDMRLLGITNDSGSVLHARDLLSSSGSLRVLGFSTFGSGILLDTRYADGRSDVLTIKTDVGGTGNTVFRVNASGAVFSDSTFNSQGADYAEWFKTSDSTLRPGDVVCIDILSENAVKRCERAADPNLMGIVSTNPAFIGNSIRGADGMKDVSGYVLVGLIGQVPAKVTTEGGAIRAGDSLTAASVPGFARRAGAGESTVGVALEPYDGTQSDDVINVLISRRNQSVTVETVEQKVLDSIASMNISDEVSRLVQSAADTLDVNDEVSAAVLAELDALDLHEQIDAIVTERLSGAVLHSSMSLTPAQISQVTQLISGAQSSGALLMSDLQTTVSSLSARVLTLESILSGSTLHAAAIKTNRLTATGFTLVSGTSSLDLTLSGTELQIGSLMSSGSLRLVGNLTVTGLATFFGNVSIQGELLLSNNQAGFAVIPATGTSVTVLFPMQMTGVPVMNVTPQGRVGSEWWVENSSATGFTIAVDKPVSTDVRFSWTALSTLDPRTAMGTGATTDAGPIVFPLDSLNRPVSTDDVWNSCIRGTPLMLASGKPVSCARYHDGYVWQHPDLGISFTYNPNHEPPILSLPDGYVSNVTVDVSASSSSSSSSESSDISSSGSSVTEGASSSADSSESTSSDASADTSSSVSSSSSNSDASSSSSSSVTSASSPPVIVGPPAPSSSSASSLSPSPSSSAPSSTSTSSTPASSASSSAPAPLPEPTPQPAPEPPSEAVPTESADPAPAPTESL